MTEILLALWNNIHDGAVAVAVASGIGASVLGIAYSLKRDIDSEEDAAPLLPWIKRSVTLFCAGLLLAIIPTLDDLWRVRIALVKYDLAAPENVRGAAETIERIGRKLECKYLGGCEDKAP